VVYRVAVYNLVCPPGVVENNPGDCGLAAVPGTKNGLTPEWLASTEACDDGEIAQMKKFFVVWISQAVSLLGSGLVQFALVLSTEW
jgi:hypothetical protein